MSSAPLTLVVLAAGIGSRYGGLKQLDPVGPHGEFILDYSIHDARRAGFTDVVCVTRRDLEADFRRLITDRWQGVMPVRLAFQELSDVPAGFAVSAERKKPWGTGHAALAARHAVQGPCAVINADDYYGASAYAQLAAWCRALPAAALAADATPQAHAMVAYQLRQTLSDHGHVSRGVCTVSATGELQQVVETLKIEREGQDARYQDAAGAWLPLAGGTPVSLNFWGFTPGIFRHLEQRFAAFLAARGADLKAEFYLPGVVDQLIHEQRATVRVLQSDEAWIGVTYPEDKPLVAARLRERLAAGHYPDNLWGRA